MARNQKPNCAPRSNVREARRIAKQQKRLESSMSVQYYSQVSEILNGNVPQPKAVRYTDVKEINPKTETQAKFFESYSQEDATGYLLYGSPGTGKTMIALYHALLDVLDQDKPEFRKIIIIRSAVSSRETGFLPGTEEEKNSVYESPYHSIVDMLIRKGAYEKLKGDGKIEFLSTSYLRGETFDNAIVIFDEFQNASFMEISTVVTRIGNDSVIMCVGDNLQNDLHYKKNDVSGGQDFVRATQRMPSFRSFKFGVDDIVRSEFVKEWILACESLHLN